MECGLVINEHMSPLAHEDTFGHLNKITSRVIRQVVIDTLQWLHLESNSVLIDTAVELYNQASYPIGSTKREETKLSSLSAECASLFACDKKREYLAYAIWEALNRQGIPKNPQDIAKICDVQPKCFLKIEKKLGKNSTDCRLSLIAEGACNARAYPYRFIRLMVQLCDAMEGCCFGRNPHTVVAACVDAILRRSKCNEFLTISRDVCSEFNVTRSTLLAIEKQCIPEFHIRDSSEIVFKSVFDL